MLAEIVLSAGTDRVIIRDMPMLIAEALHPDISQDATRHVTEVRKKPKEGLRTLPLTNEEWAALQSGCWKDLPPPALPMDEATWPVYFKAFSTSPQATKWTLVATVESGHEQNEILQAAVADDWMKKIQNDVLDGKLIPLNPTTLLPASQARGRFLKSCFVPLREFQIYVSSYHFDVRLLPHTVQGVHGISTMNAAAFKEYQACLADRRANGRYTLEEAAMEIAANTGERDDELLDKLKQAAWDGQLAVYEPGKRAKYRYGEGGASHVREFYEEAFRSDLNDWLAKHEPRITFQFPAPSDGRQGEAAQAEREESSPTTAGLTREKILAVNWPLRASFGQDSLGEALSNTPNWIMPARIMPGRPGKHGSAVWNPVLLAVALRGRKHVTNLSALDKLFTSQLPAWLDAWNTAKENL